MCNPKPTSASSFLSPTKSHPKVVYPSSDDQTQDELHRWPTLNEVMKQNLVNTRKSKL